MCYSISLYGGYNKASRCHTFSSKVNRRSGRHEAQVCVLEKMKVSHKVMQKTIPARIVSLEHM